MKQRFRLARRGSPVLLFLIGTSLTLIIMNGCLYKRYKTYRQENRDLIIQNDSILSINIELNEQLNNYKRTVFKNRENR